MSEINSYANLNLNFNEIVQGRIENLAAASFPSAGASQKGRLIFDTTNSVLKYCDGTKWINANINNVAAPTGDGNVITSVSYDPETGVLTPVKGITALTSHQSLADYVTGPASSTDAHVATFDGATGKAIKDSGFTIGTSVPSDAVFTDTHVSAEANHYAPSGTTVPTLNTATTPTEDTIEVVSQVKGDGKGHVVSQDRVTVPTKKYIDESLAELGSALLFKGTLDSTATESGDVKNDVPASHKVGDAWLVTRAGTYAGETCESGDLVVCIKTRTTANNSDWKVIQGNWTAVAGSSVLTWDTETILATIGGVEIKAKLPANPDTHYTATIKAGASTGTDNAAQSNPYVKIVENDAVTSSVKLQGGGSVSIVSDANGNIEITGTDTNTTYNMAVGDTGTTTSAAASDPYLKLINTTDGSVVASKQIKGAGSASVASDSSGNITITGTDTGATSLSGNTAETGKAITSASYDANTRTITFGKESFLKTHQSLAGLARHYSGSVTLTQSGREYVGTVTKGTHRCGKYPQVKTYIEDNSYNLTEVFMEVNVNSAGDITLKSNIAVSGLRVVVQGYAE